MFFLGYEMMCLMIYIDNELSNFSDAGFLSYMALSFNIKEKIISYLTFSFQINILSIRRPLQTLLFQIQEMA